MLGLSQFGDAMSKAADQFPTKAKTNLGKAAEIVIANAQYEQMGGNRTRAYFKVSGGRLVKRRFRGNQKPNVTAKPDQLGILFGFLRRSISADVKQVSLRKYQAEIGPKGVPYARIHELGGMTGRGHKVKMPKRPYMAPAEKATREDVLKLLGRTFEFEV